MKRKNLKIRISALLMAAVMAMPVPVLAAEEDVVYGNVEDVISELQADEAYYEADVQMTTDGYSRASWGKGLLWITNEEGQNPYGHAETRTYSGTAYYLYVRTVLIDDDSIHYETEKEIYSSSSVSTGDLRSPTMKCEFRGEHKIKDTSSSGTQTCDTYKKIS